MGDMGKELDSLRLKPLAEVQREWEARLGIKPPKVRSADALARMLAWRIQERQHGGLDPDLKARLRRLGKDSDREPDRPKRIRPSLSPGTTLVREWQGGTHHVRVTDAGFEYAGQGYGSLSEVARAITGTRWSGPRFFGLVAKSDWRVTA